MWRCGIESNAQDYLIAMSKWFDKPETLLVRYESGEFIFGKDRDFRSLRMGLGPQKIPSQWGFEEIEFVDNLGYDQGAAVLRKRFS